MALLFDGNMSWDNYGIYWEIDHIIPLSLCKSDDPKSSEFLWFWRLDNLQPLTINENRSKGSKVPESLMEEYKNVKFL